MNSSVMSSGDVAHILIQWGLPLLLLAGLLLELGLRWGFGFGNPLLYRSHETIGYLLAPNQDVRRFGNRIQINHFSMRSEAIAPQPQANTLRLLLLGDSIANGGWWTAQNETLSARLQTHLRQTLLSDLLSDLQSAGSQSPDLQSSNLPENLPETHASAHASIEVLNIEVLNASANSWGPRNELAYLQSYGLFGASTLILLINTDDLFATAPTSVQVGRDRNYPDRKPPLAVAEVAKRYLMSPDPIPELEAVQAEGGDRVGKNLEAIRQIQSLTQEAGGRCLLAMTPLLRELGEPGSRDYELKARDRLMAFTEAQQLPYLDFLPVFNQAESPASLYRDHIHLSRYANEVVVAHLTRTLIAPPFSLRSQLPGWGQSSG